MCVFLPAFTQADYNTVTSQSMLVAFCLLISIVLLIDSDAAKLCDPSRTH